MATGRIETRQPTGPPSEPAWVTDPDRLQGVGEDAAHVRGEAAALVMPASEAEIAAVLRTQASVLPIGAQSSLTGGATPTGGTVLSTARLTRILEIGGDRVRLEPGVTLAELDAALASVGAYYPPAPTYTGASVGGTVATNAAGAATFKYGTTREWVEGLTVVLPSGAILDLVRNQTRAHSDGYFELVTDGTTTRVPIPTYRMPVVPKVSAGYFAQPGMDMVDLFVGAEGTLGVISSVTLRVVPTRPNSCLAFVPFADRHEALLVVRALCQQARATWRSHDPAGIDVSAIEHLDGRCLTLAREDGLDAKSGLTWPDRTALALMVTLELPQEITAERAFEQIASAGHPSGPDSALARFCRLLDEASVLDDTQLAVPGDRARAAQFLTLREEVPASVNRRVGRAKESVDSRIEKTAGDMIVPFDRTEDLLRLSDQVLSARGLDAAIWGHISDGNLHPNILPRSFADVEAGQAAIVEIARAVIRMGGSPLAEHGVGRNAVKQHLLELLYGPDGIDQMRAVKRAVDPSWKLAPGVLFPRR
jgi:D-lactate dehydrogenase (cytochrome)